MIVHSAQAGSDGKSDCFVTVKPAETMEWKYQGRNSQLFATRTDSLIRETLDRYGSPKVRLIVGDFGALPFVIRARVEVALERALKERA